MKLKMKLMAAALALAASAGANAAMDNFQSGNGSLAFIAIDSTGSPISMMMDLDFNVDSFLPAAMSVPGTVIKWNFNTNSLTVNGVASASTQTNWSGALASFNAVAQVADTKWAVIAGDSSTDAFGVDIARYLSTAKPGTTLATMQSQTEANLYGFAGVDLLFNANGNAATGLQSTSSGLNGSTAASGNAYVGQNFGITSVGGKWKNKASFDAYTNVGNDMVDFYMLDERDGFDPSGKTDGTTRALITPYAGTFTYNAGELIYAAVPEPSEYALMLAGLGMIGFMARRRLNHRA